jgi:hypothetical protein
MIDSHLSQLHLEESALGLGRRAAQKHLATCERCRGEVRLLQRRADEVRQSAGFLGVRAKLRAEASAKKSRSSKGRWLIGGFAAVACTLLLVARTIQPEDRLKGAAGLWVMSTTTMAAVSELAPKQRAILQVNPAGHPFALVGALDESGRAELLWPQGSSQSGRVEGARPLAPQFEATPGATRLYAFFSNAPIQWSEAKAALESVAFSSSQFDTWHAPVILHGEEARATAILRVPASP